MTPRKKTARAEPGPTQRAIQQKKPFRSDGQEAFVALLLTAEALRWPVQDLLASRSELTMQQYNVLRILRGAGRDGLPTLEIGARMIERTPGVTRLVDRLEAKGLVARERSADDRRQVRCTITGEGLALLRELDRPVDALDERLFAALAPAELRQLIELLDRVRDARPAFER